MNQKSEKHTVNEPKHARRQIAMPIRSHLESIYNSSPTKIQHRLVVASYVVRYIAGAPIQMCRPRIRMPVEVRESALATNTYDVKTRTMGQNV